MTPEQLNLAVRNLFDTGLFEDVQVMPEAGRLVITVKENPTINQIAFEGNDALDDDELTEVIQLRPRLAYSVPAAEADAQRIIEAYRAAGRYAAAVNPVIIRQSENRVDLVFEISEGRKTGVQRISFIGNQAFSDRRLRRVIQTSQSNWLSFIFGGNTYDADRLEARQGAAAAVLPRARLHRRAGAVRDRRAGARAHRLLPVLHRLRGPAVQLRQGLGQLVDPRRSTPPTSSRCSRRWRTAASTTSSWSTASSSA